MSRTFAAALGIALLCEPAAARPPSIVRTIASVAPDRETGRMVIAYDDGHQVFVGRCGDEAAFSAPTRSPDGQTVAWTAFTDAARGDASTLVLYRGGHVLSRIEADPGIADWSFYGHGSWIGIARKAETGKPGSCAMYDARSGDPAGVIDGQTGAAHPCALAFRSLGRRDK